MPYLDEQQHSSLRCVHLFSVFLFSFFVWGRRREFQIQMNDLSISKFQICAVRVKNAAGSVSQIETKASAEQLQQFGKLVGRQCLQFSLGYWYPLWTAAIERKKISNWLTCPSVPRGVTSRFKERGNRCGTHSTYWKCLFLCSSCPTEQIRSLTLTVPFFLNCVCPKNGFRSRVVGVSVNWRALVDLVPCLDTRM